MGAEKVQWSGVDIQSLQAVIFHSAKNEWSGPFFSSLQPIYLVWTATAHWSISLFLSLFLSLWLLVLSKNKSDATAEVPIKPLLKGLRPVL